MDIKEKMVCFLGDSITEGVGASVSENCYVKVFERISGARTYNAGISGTRIARQQIINPDTISYDTNDFITRIDKLPREASAVVVFGGTNDFCHGDAPFGTFEDNTLDTFCGALHCLSKALIERFPSAEIIFMTPLHRVDENIPNQSNGLILQDYVNSIKRAAESYSFPVLDLYALSGMQPRIEVQNKLYFDDGLHPNDNGHKRIAHKLIEFIKTL